MATTTRSADHTPGRPSYFARSCRYVRHGEIRQVAEKIQVPANVDPSVGGLEITTSPSLAAASLDSLDYLQAYPYDCSEQNASTLFPERRDVSGVKRFWHCERYAQKRI